MANYLPHQHNLNELKGKEIVIQPDRIECEEISVMILTGDAINERYHTALMCASMKDVVADDEPVYDLYTIRLFVQAMINVFGSRIVALAGLKRVLRDYANVELNVTEIPMNSARAEELLEDEEYKAGKVLFNLSQVSNPNVTMLAYSATVLLLAGKRVSKLSVKNWTETRVRGLCAAMGTNIDIGNVTTLNLVTAQRIYQKMSFLTSLRAILIRILMGSAGTNTLTAKVSASMLNLLAFAEMGHIRAVQELIFGKFPELLAMRELQGSLRILKDAWEYLQGLPEKERPYAKMLYNGLQTKALQRDRFVLITDAAFAVDPNIYSSYQHYPGPSGPMGYQIQRKVSAYLHSLVKDTSRTSSK